MLRSIGKNAFKGCTNLLRLCIPDTVTSIAANQANLDTSGRTSLSTFPDAGSISSWAKDAVQRTVDGKPVTVFGESAFENNATITTIDHPDSIKIIKKRAFANSKILQMN